MSMPTRVPASVSAVSAPVTTAGSTAGSTARLARFATDLRFHDLPGPSPRSPAMTVMERW
jgi:hypothetical protein